MIPFNRPHLTGNEQAYLAEALASGHLAGDGPFTERATELLRSITGSPRVLLTTSCTHALELSVALVGVGSGDEVIVPSFTFVSTANAIIQRGGTPVFVDIRPDTWNLDERLVERAITNRTRAIMVVHYAGVACEMDEILALADAYGLAVIEDDAHGLGGAYRGRPLGTLGSLGTLSFHETKNIHCGEGGALLIGDEQLAARAEIMREKGTNRSRFMRGEVEKYTWVDQGSSYLPSDMLAAVLTAQLESFGAIQAARHSVWSRYESGLRPWAEAIGASLQEVGDDRCHPAHIFGVVHRDLDTRDRFIRHMADGGVKTSFHFVPLHSAPFGRSVAGDVCLPVTDAVASGLVRLPLYPDLDDADVERVIERAAAFTG